MKKLRGLLAALALAMIGMAAVTQAAGAAGPPLPVAKNGNKVKVFASGVAVPTQIAFKDNTAFIAGGSEGKLKGGLYYVSPGKTTAKRVPGTPPNAFGVTWHHDHLYANFGAEIRIFSGWTGKRFKQSRTLVRFNPKKFTNFSGLEFGPNGRLYTGVGLQFDRKASKRPYANSVISIDRHSGSIRSVATGIRQPWMLTFVNGFNAPFVTDLGQDTPKGTKAPDFIAHATAGANFGFPSCNWSNVKSCRKHGFKRPSVIFPAADPSPSPMGITAKGRKLFVALFGSQKVISTSVKGSKIHDLVTGFVAPVLLAHYRGGYLYMGDLTGQVYRVKV